MSNGIPTKTVATRRKAPSPLLDGLASKGPALIQAAVTAALMDGCECRCCKACRQAASLMVDETLGGSDGST